MPLGNEYISEREKWKIFKNADGLEFFKKVKFTLITGIFYSYIERVNIEIVWS